MIMNNENKNLSRNRNRRIERKNKMNYDMKLILNKIKSEKKRNLKTMKKLNN